MLELLTQPPALYSCVCFAVREKSKALVELLNDNARVRAEREKARNLKDKFVGACR
jgi:hypothetical protein